MGWIEVSSGRITHSIDEVWVEQSLRQPEPLRSELSVVPIRELERTSWSLKDVSGTSPKRKPTREKSSVWAFFLPFEGDKTKLDASPLFSSLPRPPLVLPLFGIRLQLTAHRKASPTQLHSSPSIPRRPSSAGTPSTKRSFRLDGPLGGSLWEVGELGRGFEF